MELNTILYTRDGRVIGNALVVDRQMDQGRVVAYKIVTDYGNTAVLTRVEIDRMFFVGPVNPSHKHANWV